MSRIGDDTIGCERDWIAGLEEMMLVVEILMTWMTWFKCNGYTIVCMKSMNWTFNILWFRSVMCTVATFH